MNARTAWEIGEESAHKPLRPFGSASVERVERPRPVRAKPVRPSKEIWGDLPDDVPSSTREEAGPAEQAAR